MLDAIRSFCDVVELTSRHKNPINMYFVPLRTWAPRRDFALRCKTHTMLYVSSYAMNGHKYSSKGFPKIYINPVPGSRITAFPGDGVLVRRNRRSGSAWINIAEKRPKSRAIRHAPAASSCTEGQMPCCFFRVPHPRVSHAAMLLCVSGNIILRLWSGHPTRPNMCVRRAHVLQQQPAGKGCL